MRADWYNRGGRQFSNGITWFRLRPWGVGLWWSSKGERDTCSHLCLFVGRWGVGLLLPRDEADHG